jgi:cobalt-zinc-cadmium efflux system outer membrane protein
MSHLLPLPISMRAAALACAWSAAALAPAARAHDMDAEAEMPADSTAVSGDSLPDLVARALRDNPSLKAAAFQVKSLHSSPAHTWSLDPPQIGVEFFQAPVRSFPNPLKNQAEVDYSVQQSFPFPGKLASRIEAEHRHAEMSEAGLAGLKRQVTLRVKTAYYELYLADRRLEFNREDQGLMRRFIEVARKQYEVGLGRQADILRAQSELTRLQADSIGLAQSRQSQAGLLNALLNRNLEAPMPVARELAPGETEWTLEQILPVLEENHPELRTLRSGIAMRQAQVRVARREYLPDITVGGAYKDMLEPPPHGGALQDYWSVMVAMNVPVALWSLPRYKAAVTQGRADLDQAEQEYADARNGLAARAQEALLKARSGRDLLRLARGVLLPQSQQALESSQSAYQGGKSEFTALLDAYRMRLAAREASEAALVRLLASQAELEEAVGLGLDEIAARLKQGGGK